MKNQKKIFFSKIQNIQGVWLKGSNNQHLKEIRALGSEIIGDDGWKTDNRQISISRALLT